MKRVIIESPFRAIDKKTARVYSAYARRAVLNSIKRREAPIAFHLFYTKYLDDADIHGRGLGFLLSQQWYEGADLVAVYSDHGISPGMVHGIQHAAQLGIEIQHRRLFARGKGSRHS